MTRLMQTNALMLLTTSPRLPLIAAVAIRFASVVTEWEHNRRTRHVLKHLDNHMLEDVGLTPAEARREAARPFWQS
ncbi:DUF1127 domain-containing protein [Falsiphaeobacter marinintestinus]|uniref:DUF1127 domain-containing protein n=1 Tax=Falsiphaeobacter marinintestinus TaxID=1492905 RepID=UPI0011B669B0|nr:DUF1127 domain-containing protein [Phaeobacter marinintestinus]